MRRERVGDMEKEGLHLGAQQAVPTMFHFKIVHTVASILHSLLLNDRASRQGSYLAVVFLSENSNVVDPSSRSKNADITTEIYAVLLQR